MTTRSSPPVTTPAETAPTSRRLHPSQPIVRAASWALVVATALVALRSLRSLVMLGWTNGVGPRGDLSVYIGALEHLATGGRLYDWHNAMGFGFTYPPFAALVLQPVTWADPTTVGTTWVVLSAALVGVLATMVALSRPRLRAAVVHPDQRPLALALVVAAVAVFAASVQVQSDLISGQVNLGIALLVLLDIGGMLPARWRGWGVGLAAAIKLTPVLAVGWFVATRQWAAAARASAVFAGSVLVGFVVLPADSAHYWGGAVLDVGRVGEVGLRFNASVTGLLAGFGLEGTRLTLAWLVLGAVVVLMGWWQAARVRADDPVAAAIIVMLTAVAASPISWPHHQIWVPLAGLVLVLRPGLAARIAGALVLLWSVLHVPLVVAADASGRFTWLTNRLDHAIVIGCCLVGLGVARHRDDRRRSSPE